MPKKSSKKSRVPEKNDSVEKIEEMVLIRDDASVSLMLVNAKQVLSINKVSKLKVGMIIIWESDGKEQRKGQVLAIGSKTECSKVMATIQKNREDASTDATKPKDYKTTPIQSTITIIEKSPTTSQLQEDEDSDSSSVNSVDEVETEESSSSIKIADVSNVSTNSRGEKRPLDNNTTDSNPRKKHLNNTLTVPYAVYSAKEQNCLEMAAQVAYYQQEWMPRPKDPKVIQYLIEITNILSGASEEEEEDIGEVLMNIMDELQMSEKDLQLCHGRSATKTARRIMKFKFPTLEAPLKIKKIDESILKAIVRYTRVSNPSDKASETSIRHAISNYIAVQKFKNKTTGSPSHSLAHGNEKRGEDTSDDA